MAVSLLANLDLIWPFMPASRMEEEPEKFELRGEKKEEALARKPGICPQS